MSDLHSEFREPGWLPPLPEDPQVIILAGDINTGDKTIDSVTRIHEARPKATIIFVAGNHEFYRHNIVHQIKNFRQSFKNHHHIHFLENEAVYVHGLQFLGCTLWSGFDALPAHSRQYSMDSAEQIVADFQLIRTDDANRKFYPSDALNRHLESKKWLDQKLQEIDSRKTVVVTHFPPIREARHQTIPEDFLANYFQAECSELIQRHQPAYWIYGHNHYSYSTELGKTRIVSNQLGYPNEKNIPIFNEDKSIYFS